mmetsp:Transcript_40603/g.95346  ORF Transcript_40603/g.95346 Transcript_40603/m.95346 type:complete len:223 (-) Transcript_40603:654-1322(-)
MTDAKNINHRVGSAPLIVGQGKLLVRQGIGSFARTALSHHGPEPAHRGQMSVEGFVQGIDGPAVVLGMKVHQPEDSVPPVETEIPRYHLHDRREPRVVAAVDVGQGEKRGRNFLRRRGEQFDAALPEGRDGDAGVRRRGEPVGDGTGGDALRLEAHRGQIRTAGVGTGLGAHDHAGDEGAEGALRGRPVGRRFASDGLPVGGYLVCSPSGGFDDQGGSGAVV